MCLLTSLVTAQNPAPTANFAPGANLKKYSVPAGTLLRMELSGPLHVAHLKLGSEIAGQLVRPVYVYDRALIPAGSQVRAVVEKVDKLKPAVKKGLMERVDSICSLGLNRHDSYEVTLRTATVKLLSGEEVPMDLRFIRGGQEVHLQADEEGRMKVGGATGKDLAQHAPGISQLSWIKRRKHQLQEFRHPAATLELTRVAHLDLPAQPAVPRAAIQPLTIPEGTRAHFLLLTDLRASESKRGDTFQTRLVEPIFWPDGQLLVPEGSVLDGHIAKVETPRRLSRAGSMYLAFDLLSEPGGDSQEVTAPVADREMAHKASATIDSEAGLHAALGAVSRKAARKGAGEVLKLATNGVVPYTSVAVSLFGLLADYGTDVDLPKYTDLLVVFGKPVTVATQPRK